jgi:hypothetical protein
MSARVVVLGIMGRTPFAGVAWQVLHYLEGLRRLGHDVYYIEDTGDWPYDPVQNTITDDCDYTVAYISRLLNRCALGDRWAYRSGADGQTYGLSERSVQEIFRDADVLINLTAGTVLREEHLRVPVRIYLETDPVMPQIEVAQERAFTIDLLSAHTHHFSFGENLGAPDCAVPVERFTYHPTRQPVVTDWWDAAIDCQEIVLTTVASWQQTGKDIEWEGETYYWSKDREFLKFIDLPGRVECSLELALACDDPQTLGFLRSHGWSTADAVALSSDIDTYRDYILGSGGEFTVAKDQNIRLRSGWFSDRSACYLAAGKPVITQDTGFGDHLPVGRGLFSFKTTEDVLTAVDAINRDYSGHSRAARDLAAEYFGAESVLSYLTARAGL